MLLTKIVNSKAFSNEGLKVCFLRYNIGLPSSAAVERLFSFTKNILEPKCRGLKNKLFEMLANLFERQLILYCLSFLTYLKVDKLAVNNP